MTTIYHDGEVAETQCEIYDPFPPKTVRVYPESVYPFEVWLYRIEGVDGSNPSGWRAGGSSKDEAIARAINRIGYAPMSITVENGR